MALSYITEVHRAVRLTPIPGARPPVAGVIAPDGQTRMRLVADRSPTGLEPSARPSLSAITNNHRMYAIQWFAFAAIALGGAGVTWWQGRRRET